MLMITSLSAAPIIYYIDNVYAPVIPSVYVIRDDIFRSRRCVYYHDLRPKRTHSQPALRTFYTQYKKKTITEQQPREKQTFKDDGNYVFTITDRFHLNVSDLCCCCLPAAAAIHIYIYLKQLHGTHTHIHILKAYILKTILQYKLINNQVNRYR